LLITSRAFTVWDISSIIFVLFHSLGLAYPLDNVTINGANQGGESLLSQIWNSPLARYLVPDEIGINITVSDVVGFGFSGSIKGVFLTRGKDAGTGNVLLSGSARVGFDVGLSATEENGWYWGWDPRKASMDQLLGTGQDLSGGWDGIVGGIWRSLDGQGNTSWVGTEAGVGLIPSPRIGISGGQGTTVTVPQFIQWLLNNFKY
jgi:hypothetical protein